MQFTINAESLSAGFGAVIGATGMAAVLWSKVIKPLRAVMKSLEQMFEDWNGVPRRPGVPARLGVMERFERSDAIQAEQGAQLRTLAETQQEQGAQLARLVAAMVPSTKDGARVSS